MFTIDLRHVGIRTDGTGRPRLLIEKRDLPMSRPPKPKADRANKKAGFNLSFFLLCASCSRSSQSSLRFGETTSTISRRLCRWGEWRLGLRQIGGDGGLFYIPDKPIAKNHREFGWWK
jgi:hypothetical protein